MRYQELMQSLEQELRAVLLIQKQDSSALKSCTAEQKDSLRLAQKLLKAYKAGKAEELVLALFGGASLSKTVTTRPSFCRDWRTDVIAAFRPLPNRVRTLCTREMGFRLDENTIDARIAALNQLREELRGFEAAQMELRPADCNEELPVSVSGGIEAMDEQIARALNSYQRLAAMAPENLNALNRISEIHAQLNRAAENEAEDQARERVAKAQVLANFNSELDKALSSSPVQFRRARPGTTESNEIRMTAEGVPLVITRTGDIAMQAHELQHFIQYTQGKLAFTTFGNREAWAGIHDIEDEVEAYRVQFIIDPQNMPFMANGLMPASLADITPAYVRQISSADGARPYENLPDGPFDMGMRVGPLNAATDDLLMNSLFMFVRDGIGIVLDEEQFNTGINLIPDINGLTIRDLLNRTFRFTIRENNVEVNFRDYILYK